MSDTQGELKQLPREDEHLKEEGDTWKALQDLGPLKLWHNRALEGEFNPCEIQANVMANGASR